MRRLIQHIIIFWAMGLPLAHAADYTPPPLFGAPATVKAKPVDPIPPPFSPDALATPASPREPIASPAPKATMTAPPAKAPTLSPPARAAAPLPKTDAMIPPPPTPATLTVDQLLAHPGQKNGQIFIPPGAGKVGEPMAPPPRPRGRAVPILDGPTPPTKTANAPVSAPVAVQPPVPAPARPPEPAPKTTMLATKPQPKAELTPPKVEEKPVLQTQKLADAPKTKVITSPKPKIDRMIAANPKAAVFSRDPVTGEFRARQDDALVVRNRASSQHIRVEASPRPAEDIANDILAPVKSSPRPPSLPVSAGLLGHKGRDDPADVTAALADKIEPLTASDLTAAMDDMNKKSPPPPPGSPKSTLLPNRPVPPDPAKVAPTQEFKVAALGAPTEDITLLDPTTLAATDLAMMTLDFATQTAASALLPTHIQDLRSKILPELTGNPEKQLEIRAYAGGRDGAVQDARRLALARGLAVRDFLKNEGIATDRMHLRALGQPSDMSSPDRVDVVIE